MPTALLPRPISPSPDAWPAAVASALWRANELGAAPSHVCPTGFAALDAVLPGGGWPGYSLTDILQAQNAVLEWRLLGPGLRLVAGADRCIAVVGPPHPPHGPGLLPAGLPPTQWVWIQARTLAERLWCTEQLIRARAFGAVVVWLDHATPAQIRRLQVGASAHEGPIFVMRPLSAQHEASAAPLRIQARPADSPWTIQLQILKRRGPALGTPLTLEALPAGLSTVLPPRARQLTYRPAAPTVPAALSTPRRPSPPGREELTHALGRTAPAHALHRLVLAR